MGDIRIHHIWENGEMVRSYYETDPNHKYYGRVDVYARINDNTHANTYDGDTTDTNDTTYTTDTNDTNNDTDTNYSDLTPMCKRSVASRMLSDINIIKKTQEMTNTTCHTAQIENLWKNRNRITNDDECFIQIDETYQTFLQDLYHETDCQQTRCGQSLIIEKDDRLELNDKWFTTKCT